MLRKKRPTPDEVIQMTEEWGRRLDSEGLSDPDRTHDEETTNDPELFEMIETLQVMSREKQNRHHELRGVPNTVEELVGLIKILKQELEGADEIEFKTSTNCKSERFHSYDSIVVIAHYGQEKYYYHFSTKHIPNYERIEVVDEITRETEISYQGHRTTEMRATDG